MDCVILLLELITLLVAPPTVGYDPFPYHFCRAMMENNFRVDYSLELADRMTYKVYARKLIACVQCERKSGETDKPFRFVSWDVDIDLEAKNASLGFHWSKEVKDFKLEKRYTLAVQLWERNMSRLRNEPFLAFYDIPGKKFDILDFREEGIMWREPSLPVPKNWDAVQPWFAFNVHESYDFVGFALKRLDNGTVSASQPAIVTYDYKKRVFEQSYNDLKGYQSVDFIYQLDKSMEIIAVFPLKRTLGVIDEFSYLIIVTHK